MAMGILYALAIGNRSRPFRVTRRPVSRCSTLAPTVPPAIADTRAISRSRRFNDRSCALASVVTTTNRNRTRLILTLLLLRFALPDNAPRDHRRYRAAAKRASMKGRVLAFGVGAID